jgi:hypothetical protein
MYEMVGDLMARKPKEPANNAAAAVQTIESLRAAGRLEAVDQAMVQAFLTVGRALDVEPSPALIREYRALEERLREQEVVDNGFAQLLESLSTPVRDATN